MTYGLRTLALRFRRSILGRLCLLAAISLMQPLTQAFLPRVSYLQVADPPAARRMVTRTLLGMGLLGMAMGATAQWIWAE